MYLISVPSHKCPLHKSRTFILFTAETQQVPKISFSLLNNIFKEMGE